MNFSLVFGIVAPNETATISSCQATTIIIIIIYVMKCSECSLFSFNCSQIYFFIHDILKKVLNLLKTFHDYIKAVLKLQR